MSNSLLKVFSDLVEENATITYVKELTISSSLLKQLKNAHYTIEFALFSELACLS